MQHAFSRLSLAWWRLRRKVKDSMPLVRREKYNRLERRYAALRDAMLSSPGAAQARIETLKAPASPPSGEVCLFVTHALHREIKPHVVVHIQCLLNAGIAVVLIVNTEIAAGELRLPPDMTQGLSALYVRENIGFDFAAWSHGMDMCLDLDRLSRLLLVNDSIVGPLSSERYGELLARMRASGADVVGLTENPSPTAHLQSFFLAFGRRALAHPEWRRIFACIRSLPSKDQVIDVYETQITHRLRSTGLSTEALFGRLTDDVRESSDVHFRWQELVERGFPFVKANIIRERPDDPRLAGLIPASFRQGVE